MKKYIKYLFVVVAVCIVFGIASNTDAATTKKTTTETSKISLGDYYIVDGVNGTFVSKQSSKPDKEYTQYKYFNDHENAYCIQSGQSGPKSGQTYYLFDLYNYDRISEDDKKTVNGKISWNKVRAIRAGMIQDKIYNERNIRGNEGYTLVYAALNTYLDAADSRRKKKGKAYSNDIINAVIDEVKSTQICTETSFKNDFKSNFKVNADKYMTFNQSGNDRFYSGKVTVTMPTSYCNTGVSYKVTLNNSDAKMYTDKSLKTLFNGNISDKTSYTFYVKIPADKINAADDINVNVQAVNKTSYKAARLWFTHDEYQMVVTADKTVKSTRTVSKSGKMIIPTIEPNKYNFMIRKVDSDGNDLVGAKLKFSVYSDSGLTNQLGTCSIAPSGAKPYICSFVYERNATLADISKFYYKVSEIVAPNGYIKVDDITGSFDASGSSNLCYVVGTDGDLTATDISDCNNTYSQSGVCKVNDSYDFNVTQENCVSDVVEEGSTDPAVIRAWENKCIANGNTIVDDSKCSNVYMKETISGNSFGLSITNTKNSVNFSKQDINGNELEGATLKVCSTKPNKNGECTVARNTMDGVCSNNNADSEDTDESSDFKNCVYDRNTDTKTVDMEWVSSDTPMLWEGLAPGKYYLVETIPAPGYKLNSSVVEFNVDNEGNITSKNYDKDNNVIVIKNELNSFTISKTDVASSKELPGAQLSICSAILDDETEKYVTSNDENGECLPASVVEGGTDGVAIWTSTEEPHKISGLPAGTYYLVEKTSPDGYDTAESILFVMNNDGTLSDIEGNSLADNKLVMEDKPLEQIKTGDIILLVIGVLAVIGAGVGFVIYKNKTGGFSDNSFIGKIIKKFKK